MPPPKPTIGSYDEKLPLNHMGRWIAASSVPPALVVLVSIACVALVILSFMFVGKSMTLEVSVSPSADSILQRTGTIRALSDQAVKSWAESAAHLMETFSNQTVSDLPKKISTIVHPRYLPTIITEYDSFIKQVRDLWFSRSVTTYPPEITDRGDGRYTIVVPYEQLDYTGGTKDARTALSPSDYVMVLEVVQDLPNDENLIGLYIIGRTKLTKDEWIKSGRTDYWKGYTTHPSR